MRMPAPAGRPAHLEHDVVGDVRAERRAEPGERAVVRVRLERRLQLGADDVALRPRQGDRCRGRADERDGDERRRPEHAPRVGERRLDRAGRAVIARRFAIATRTSQATDGDEEREARLRRASAACTTPRAMPTTSSSAGGSDGGGRTAAAQRDRHRGGRGDEPEQERRHQQRLVRADGHRDRDELLPRQRGAGDELDESRRASAGRRRSRRPGTAAGTPSTR